MEINPLAEEFYQRLMICYQCSGYKSEAINIYHHCRKVLAHSLGTGPSLETEAIYKAMLE